MFKKILILSIFLSFFLLHTPITFAQSLFYDSFDTTNIDTDKWTETDTENKLDQSRGYLQIKGGKASAAYSDPAIYSNETFSRVGGRALVSIIRSSVSYAEGPVMHFSPSTFPANPTITGYGISLDTESGGNTPLKSRVTAIFPGGKIAYLTPVDGTTYDSQTAKSIDYMTTTVLRPNGGSYHLVSGGAFGTFPSATLIWVNHLGTDNTVNVGINNKNGQAWMHSTKVVDLSGNFATQNGLATAYDTFSRTDSSTLGSSETGSFAWTEVVGNWAISSNKVVRTSSAATRNLAVMENVGADGIYEMDITPTTTANPYLIFRYSDSNNYWYAEFNRGAGAFAVWKVVNGVKEGLNPPTNSQPIMGGSAPMTAGTTYRITVILHDSSICIAKDGLSLGCRSNTFNQTATGVGIGSENFDGGTTFDNIAFWPRTVTLPSEVGELSTIPTSTSTTIASDTFTDANGTLLQNHTMNQGNGWTIGGTRTWTINSNAVTPNNVSSGNKAIAVTEAGVTDMAVSAQLTLPDSTSNPGDPEWFSGVILRYEDDNNYTWARFLWQDGSPEIEIWDIVNGNVSPNIFTPPGFLNATNITNIQSIGNNPVIKFVVVGNQVAAYMNGTLIVKGTTSRLNGTKAGMIIDPDNGVTSPMSTFDNFLIQTAEADTVEPPAVDSLESTSGTYNELDPVLNWTTVFDDASGTSYYRVYRSTNSGSLGSQINSNGSTTTGTFTDTTLSTSGTYYYTIRTVDAAGNESSSDDNNQISVNYIAPSPTPTNTLTPTPTTTTTPQPSSAPTSTITHTSKNEVLPEAPLCSNTKPSSSPDLFQIDITDRTATLHFTPAGEPVNKYFIAYGTYEGSEEYGVEFVQDDSSGAIKYTINALTPNKTYYFKVRGSNECQPGPWGNNLKAITSPNATQMESYTKFGKLVKASDQKSIISTPDSPIKLSSPSATPIQLTSTPMPPTEVESLPVPIKKFCILWDIVCF